MSRKPKRYCGSVGIRNMVTKMWENGIFGIDAACGRVGKPKYILYDMANPLRIDFCGRATCKRNSKVLSGEGYIFKMVRVKK